VGVRRQSGAKTEWKLYKIKLNTFAISVPPVPGIKSQYIRDYTKHFSLDVVCFPDRTQLIVEGIGWKMLKKVNIYSV
jgi:hypothetical protein